MHKIWEKNDPLNLLINLSAQIISFNYLQIKTHRKF